MDIKAFQNALLAAGYPLPKFGADGYYGTETREAMQRFQRDHHLPVTDKPDTATTRALMGKLADGAADVISAGVFNDFKQPKATRPINEIILHCTATPEGRDVSVETIRGWHKGQGWNDIGYHWVVGLDGVPRPGRPEAQVGAHVSGHNTGTLGVVYVGGVAADGKTAKDTRTEAQRAGLISIVKGLIKRYPTITKISGHNEYANKACPSFNVQKDPISKLV